MRVVWKFPLEPSGIQWISLPRGASFLCAQWQQSSGEACVWVLCDPDETVIEKRTVRVLMTGEQIANDRMDGFVYLSTGQTPSGIVFHVFYDSAAPDSATSDATSGRAE